MNIPFFISWRYLYARRKQVFISLVTVISIAGVAVGVAALIVTLSIMNGFQSDLKNKILASNPHVVVMDYRKQNISEYKEVTDQLKDFPDVLGVSPFVYGQGMLKKGNVTEGIVVKGVTKEEQNVTRLKNYLKSDSFFVDDNSSKDVVIGKFLSKKLQADIGDEVIFIAPSSQMTALGQVPRWEKCIVKDVIETGMYEYDMHFVYMKFSNAQCVFGIGDKASGIGVRIKDAYNAEETAERINKVFPKLFARSWQRMNYSLFSALKLEKIVMFIVLTLIIIVAAFGIISSLMLLTIEKTKDIGILKAMGCPAKKIRKIFLYEGLIIGSVGTCIGLILGLGISLILKHYNIITLPADVYYVTRLPVNIRIFDIGITVVAAMCISLIATWYPALRAGKLHPSEALRYE